MICKTKMKQHNNFTRNSETMKLFCICVFLMLLYETKTGQNVDAELKLEDKANLVKISYKTYGRKNGKPYKTQWKNNMKNLMTKINE